MFRHSSSNVFEPAECSTENGIFTMIISLSMFYKMAWDPVNNLLASGPHPPQQKKTYAYPNTTEWVSPLSSSYGLLQRGGGGKAGCLCRSHWWSEHSRGPRRHRQWQYVWGSREIKKSRNIHSGYIFVCSDFRVRGKNPDLEDMFLATNWNDCCIKVKLYFAIIKAGIFVSLAAPIPSHCYI